MAALFRVCLLIPVFFAVSCASRDEARDQGGLPQDEASQIPSATPGPGWEKVKTRPDATPTPRPNSPMDKPLDPTGLPQG
jgi:hypothetical protein